MNLSDDFGRMDQYHLSPSPAGWTWTELLSASSNWFLSGMHALLAHGGGNQAARAELDLSTADHVAQVDLVMLAAGNAGGVCVRMDTAGSFYALSVASDGTAKILRYVAASGTWTQLGDSVTVALNLPETWSLQASGDLLIARQGNIAVLTVSDTALSGTRTGMFAYSRDEGPSTLDNFGAYDGPARHVRKQAWTLEQIANPVVRGADPVRVYSVWEG